MSNEEPSKTDDGQSRLTVGLERFSAKTAEITGAIVIGKDGHEYEYIAGPDRKGGVVLFIRSFDYYKILWVTQIAGVRLPSNLNSTTP